MTLHPPRPLREDHALTGFESGRAAIDEWLIKRAVRNDGAGASRTYVVCDDGGEDGRVLAHCALAVGSVQHSQAPGSVRRTMPDPIPVMILARLGVDVSVQGRGIGRGLLRDAILRTLRAARIAGIRALLVHALDEAAAAFYQRNGFLDSPIGSVVLMLPLEHARKAPPCAP